MLGYAFGGGCEETVADAEKLALLCMNNREVVRKWDRVAVGLPNTCPFNRAIFGRHEQRSLVIIISRLTTINKTCEKVGPARRRYKYLPTFKIK